MAEVTKDFEELFRFFANHDVRSVIVGAHAVAFHAKPRYTKDIDLLLEPTRENAVRVLAALDEFGFGGLGVAIEDLAAPGRILQLGQPPNRIDLITSIDGVTFDEVWSGKESGKYGTVDVWFIGRQDLIRNKRAAGRPQDLSDLSWLERSGSSGRD
jgi:hypothetical protein